VCGLASPDAGANRIVGGEEATPGEWPWVVSLEMRDSGGGTYSCGGAILTKTHILTAAHCLPQFMESVTVRAGAHNVFSLGSDVQSVTSNSWVNHENYDDQTSENDVSVITLPSELTWSNTVMPLCLPQAETFEGDEAVVAGWGATLEGGSTSDVLREVALNVVSNAQCVSDYSTVGYSVFSTNICAAAPGKDSCQGDSGGSLFHKTTSDQWASIGIVSFGEGCARPEYPGVYARTSDYNSWILDKVSSGSC